MKLFTICNETESLFKEKYVNNIKLCDYTIDDYKRFLEVGKNHHIYMRRYWYETDMSDSSSGTIHHYNTINQSNMIIKDNELYGVLVSTRGYFPTYRILTLESKHQKLALGGGYNTDDYDWYLRDNDLSNKETLEASTNYVLVDEMRVYSIKDTNEKELSRIEREVIGLLQSSCLINNNQVIGFKYDGHEYIIDDKESLTIETTKFDGNKAEYKYIKKLYKVDEDYLEKNIFTISYSDWKKQYFNN